VKGVSTHAKTTFFHGAPFTFSLFTSASVCPYETKYASDRHYSPNSGIVLNAIF
jgi:hypothetical protein